MAATETVRPLAAPAAVGRIAIRRAVARLTWYHLGLFVVIGVAAPLHLAALDREGYGNTYYAAAVKSMITSWHNFFFVSFDAGGFVSVDKPPLGLWIQAMSAKLFGFHPLSLLLPQALAGMAAVALLYHLVARSFGVVAGVLAGVALAIMPISVVTNRNNTMDGMLILFLLGAAWAVSVAAETGRLGPLLLGAALVGLGFNIKMLQAYLVVPAFALMYLIGSNARWPRRIGHLLLAGMLLLVVSLSWMLAVDLTPTSARPYVGSSGTNSALSLALGYNGLNRLTDAFFTRFPGLRFFSIPVDLNVAPGASPGIGEPGVTRLLNSGLAGQVGWLLPLAVLGLAVAIWQVAREADTLARRRRRVAVALWGGWLVAAGAFFDFARFFHTYYLIMLGPAIAALVGIGGVTLARWYRAGGVKSWLLPVALLLAAYAQRDILADYPDWSSKLTPVIVGGCVLAAAVLVIARLRIPRSFLVVRTGWALGMVALLVAPAVWSFISVQNGNGGAWLPQAGPRATMFFGGPGGGPGRETTGVQGANRQPRQGQGQAPAAPTDGRALPAGNTSGSPGAPSSVPGTGTLAGGGGLGFGRGGGAMTFAGNQWNSLDPNLVRYLETNHGSDRYLVATATSSYASLFILATDQPALALSGYQGWDRVVTPAELAQMVHDGTVRFFYLDGGGASPGGRGGTDANADLTQWVRSSCTAVPASTWSGTTARTTGGGFGQASQLYDCAATAAGTG